MQILSSLRFVHVQVNRFETEKTIKMTRRQIKLCRNTTPFKTSVIPLLEMLKGLILSTPDRNCHQAPRPVEFFAIKLLAPWSLAIISPLVVFIGSYRHPIQLLSDFG